MITYERFAQWMREHGLEPDRVMSIEIVPSAWDSTQDAIIHLRAVQVVLDGNGLLVADGKKDVSTEVVTVPMVSLP